MNDWYRQKVRQMKKDHLKIEKRKKQKIFNEKLDQLLIENKIGKS